MGFFDSKSTTVQTTTNTVENKHATAGADGFAVGANSNVQIEQVSDDIAIASLDANERIARDAFGLADDSIQRLGDFADGALYHTLGFAQDFAARENEKTEKQMELQNRFAQSQTELIAAQAGVVAPTDSKRNQTLVFVSLGVVAAIVLLPQLVAATKAAK